MNTKKLSTSRSIFKPDQPLRKIMVMRIGVFVGSIRREGRGATIGKWVLDSVADVAGAEFGLVDLKDFNVPLLDVPYMPAGCEGSYPDPEVQRFADAVASYDGFIFVTPEYNGGVPGPMKNAVDHLMVEWSGKPVAFVGYGGNGAARAVTAWRPIVKNFKMRDVENALALNVFGEDAQGEEFAPRPEKAEELKAIVAELLKEEA